MVCGHCCGLHHGASMALRTLLSWLPPDPRLPSEPPAHRSTRPRTCGSKRDNNLRSRKRIGGSGISRRSHISCELTACCPRQSRLPAPANNVRRECTLSRVVRQQTHVHSSRQRFARSIERCLRAALARRLHSRKRKEVNVVPSHSGTQRQAMHLTFHDSRLDGHRSVFANRSHACTGWVRGSRSFGCTLCRLLADHTTLVSGKPICDRCIHGAMYHTCQA